MTKKMMTGKVMTGEMRRRWRTALCGMLMVLMLAVMAFLTGCSLAGEDVSGDDGDAAKRGSTLANPEQSSDSGDRMIGALAWVGIDEDDESRFAEPPEPETIQVEYVGEGADREVKVNRDDMLGAYVLLEWVDGELDAISSYTDPRFIEAPMNSIVGGMNEIDTTMYVDGLEDVSFFLYKVCETPTGELYVKDRTTGYGFGEAGGANWLEETNDDGSGVRIKFNYENYKACDSMVVKQFDANDQCIASTSFVPDEEVSLEKADGMAYAICEYHRGDEVERKVVVDDVVERIVVDPKTRIGARDDIKME